MITTPLFVGIGEVKKMMSEIEIIQKYDEVVVRYSRLMAKKLRRIKALAPSSLDLYQYGMIGAIRRFRKGGDKAIPAAAYNAMVDGIRKEMHRKESGKSRLHEVSIFLLPIKEKKVIGI
jgi:DNA-directed RNA polymerase specialized sigma subunit